MKLLAIRSLDEGDPIAPLGQRVPHKEEVPAPPPAAVPVAPGVWQGPDGKLETRIESNEAAKFGDASMREVGMLQVHAYAYGGTSTGRMSGASSNLEELPKSGKVNPWTIPFGDRVEELPEKVWRSVTPEQFEQEYLCDFKTNVRDSMTNSSVDAEHASWLCRGKRPRELQIGETVRIEDVQDGYVTVRGMFSNDAITHTVTRLA